MLIGIYLGRIEGCHPDVPDGGGGDHVSGGVPHHAAQVVHVVRVVSEHGALLPVVDLVDDVLRGQAGDHVLLVAPDLEQGVLRAPVVQRLDQVAVDLRGELALLVVLLLLLLLLLLALLFLAEAPLLLFPLLLRLFLALRELICSRSQNWLSFTNASWRK